MAFVECCVGCSDCSRRIYVTLRQRVARRSFRAASHSVIEQGRGKCDHRPFDLNEIPPRYGEAISHWGADQLIGWVTACFRLEQKFQGGAKFVEALLSELMLPVVLDGQGAGPHDP